MKSSCAVNVDQHYSDIVHVYCCRLISEHREALENDIYAEGIEHVRRLLCSDFTMICPMHALYDTGEL